ncbi:MAG: Rieske 2Fe-2S domain-containing protein [Pseudomonadota bacterium]
MAAETNARWLPVAVSADILSGTVIPASLPTGPIAVWRSATGRLNANKDRCPHRGMRLSHGFVRGETLSCIYHGWRFGADGACRKIPAHPALVPPRTISCGPLPVAECNGTVWAAAKRPDHEPVAYDGYMALRSVVIAASCAAVETACQGARAHGAIKTRLGGHDTLLVMNGYAPNAVLVIVLVAETMPVAGRLAISTALEALRRTVETWGRAA